MSIFKTEFFSKLITPSPILCSPDFRSRRMSLCNPQGTGQETILDFSLSFNLH